MKKWVNKLFGRREPRFKIIESPVEHAVLLAQSCRDGLLKCLEKANRSRHEGVCFLLGRTDGRTALCLQAVQPKAVTTEGSFHVPASEMAKIVRLATDLKLQIVAQVHTHPGEAYHSDGDEDGANIRFEGFISIVVPNYGTALPSFEGSAIYIFTTEKKWKMIPLRQLRVLPSQILT